MKMVSVQLDKTKRIIAEKIVLADRYLIRLRGLIGKKSLSQGEGMYFPNCQSVHMWFMAFPIDIVFLRKNLDGKRTVTSTHSRVKPWGLLPTSDWKANDVLELPEGTIKKEGIQPGDSLCIS